MQPDPVPPLLDLDAVAERAEDLLAAGLNGLRLGLVALSPPDARLEIFFHNALHLADILAEVAATPARAGQIFRLRGGHRILAGPGLGQLRCTGVAAGSVPESLLLTLTPIGDYSTYTLEVAWNPARIDPVFAELRFRFRPGCFTHDCSPAWTAGRPTLPAPAIDYLAKDYDSFRHVLIGAMAARVPGWAETSEADLDQVLIDLFAAAADELSDYQDRVANEAYLATARNRVSLARHARLVDYHLHQGNQASSWLAILLDDAAAPFSLGGELIAWAGHPEAPETRVYFATRETWLPPAGRAILDPLLNTLHLHSWSGSRPALRAGTTAADLVSARPGAAQPEAERIRDLIRAGSLKHLLIEEKLDPATGREPGRDPKKRQLLELRDAEAMRDPLTGIWLTRVTWREADALRADYAFEIRCAAGPVRGVSAFHGNLLRAHQGLPVTTVFHEPGSELPADGATLAHRHFARIRRHGVERSALCRLPFAPLAYLPTPADGETPPRSTLRVAVTLGGVTDPWDEVTSLVHSGSGAEDGDHFVAETDELRRSTLRFGNGINGTRLPDGAVVTATYQFGDGAAGNVGAGAITGFAGGGDILALWNPFDVTDGRDPEPVSRVLRQAPEAYRARQLRAITTADYVVRAQEVPGVARAAARHAWTGSWRTVRVVIDPSGTTELAPALRAAVAAHLEAVRLIGEDLEIRPPRFVPVTVTLGLCLRPDVWPEDIRAVIEAELSDGLTPDGRPGLFHPDRWSFGQALHASVLAGRVGAIPGVEHITHLDLKRYDAATPGGPEAAVLEMGFDEIPLIQNDPDHMERGGIVLTLTGGRQ